QLLGVTKTSHERSQGPGSVLAPCLLELRRRHASDLSEQAQLRAIQVDLFAYPLHGQRHGRTTGLSLNTNRSHRSRQTHDVGGAQARLTTSASQPQAHRKDLALSGSEVVTKAHQHRADLFNVSVRQAQDVVEARQLSRSLFGRQ